MAVASQQPSEPTVRWAVRPPAPPAEIAKLSRSLSIPPLLAGILWSRGLQDEAASYLNPPLALTQIPDLDAAAERLEHALTHKRRILIHGDYDADGISGTAVLTLGLRALGGNVTPFIPNRLNEGYGIYPGKVDEHIANADLFITVDCGISNLDELKRLQEAGVEVIVSDHHQPGTEMPDCLIVHPKTSPLAKQGLPELTGAGVAYHLLWALHERLGLEPPVEYSDIASIGTIADVAPLMGENRALIVEGLARMSDTKWPGLRATIRQNKLKDITARDVAFILAPRLNAAGRLGEADMGLELLMTASERRAKELAVYLDARNTERRKIQDEMFNHALSKVDPDAPALVLDDPGWHPGIMGIVASKILERYYKPVFIIAKGKGSVRSTPGISAVNGLHHAAAHLKRFGGHSQAAGFAIKEGDVEAFRRSIFEYVESHPTPQRTITADVLLSSSQIDDDLYRAVCDLEPYGEGHPSPQFALTDTLDMARAVGGTKTTLQLRVAGVKGVAWQKGHMASSLPAGEKINTVISLRENFWNDKRSLEFIAEDIRPAKPLGFTEASTNSGRIFRGRAPEPSSLIETLSDTTAIKEKNVWLKHLPLHDEPLCAAKTLSTLVAADKTLYFDLDARALYDLEHALNQYPSLQDVRRGFVFLQRGQTLPYEGTKADLVQKVLHDLELLNEQGRPLRGQKRDPYSSETLLKGLLERYKLQTFLNAYRHLDDGAFAQTVWTLFKS